MARRSGRSCARYGITVSIILPGYVDTEMSRSLPFAKPMLLSPEAMARKIRRGMEKGKPRIVAPVPVGLVMQALSLLPVSIADPLLERLRMHSDDET